MRYVEWVQRVAGAYASLPSDGPYLQGEVEVWRALGLKDDDTHIVWRALEDLDRLGIVDASDPNWIKPTQNVRAIRHGANLQQFWPSIVGQFLDPQQEAVLTALVHLSERRDADWATVEPVDLHDLWRDIGWDEHDRDPFFLVNGLAELGLLKARLFGGPSGTLYPTYHGVVRATERVATEWQDRLDAMVAEWETTTVEFKREIELGTPKRNAEFARDITALANTKASGQLRYLIVGYDPDTHIFVRSIDPDLDQDRLEQVLNAYAAPSLDLRYFTVEHQTGGSVGIVEVRRLQEKLPYRVVKTGGKITADSLFVRHGSQIELPTEAELAALLAEGQRVT